MKLLAMDILNAVVVYCGGAALMWWLKTEIVRFIQNFDTDGWRTTLVYFGILVEDDEDE